MKIKLEEFNNCEPDRIKEVLNNYRYKVIDIEKEYWQNNDDTLVIEVSKNNLDSLLGIITRINNSDEVNYIITTDDVIIRFWWD